MTEMIGKKKQLLLIITVSLLGLSAAACSAQNEAIPSPVTSTVTVEDLDISAEAATSYVSPAYVEGVSFTVEDAPQPETVEAEPLDLSFDPNSPYRFCQGESCVDFLEPDALTIAMPFIDSAITVNPVLHDSSVSFDESLPVCGENLLVTNARDGDSENEVWHKTVLYAHSGNCYGEWHPSEYFRDYLEGGYLLPNEEQREQRIEELRGQALTFDQGNGAVTFQIVDIAYLDQEQVEQEYLPDPGSLDQHFDTGVQEGVHEAFWVFCGSVGLTRPNDPFVTRYVLRLQVAPPVEAASSQSSISQG